MHCYFIVYCENIKLLLVFTALLNIEHRKNMFYFISFDINVNDAPLLIRSKKLNVPMFYNEAKLKYLRFWRRKLIISYYLKYYIKETNEDGS